MSDPSLTNARPVPLSPIHQVASRLPAKKRVNILTSSTNSLASSTASLSSSSTSQSSSTSSLSKRSKLDLRTDSEPSLRREVLLKQAQAIPEINILKSEDEVECHLNASKDSSGKGGTKPVSSEEMVEISDNSDIIVVTDSSLELEELLQESLPGPVKGESEVKNVEEASGFGDGSAQSKIVNLEVKSVKTKKRKREEVQVRWRDVKRLKRKTKFFSFCEVFGGNVEVMTLGEVESRKVPKVLGGRKPLTLVPGLDYGLGEGEGMVLTEEEEREVNINVDL